MAGAAQRGQQSLSKEPILILTAIAAVYILLGVLYESYIHPSPFCRRCRRPASVRFWRSCSSMSNSILSV